MFEHKVTQETLAHEIGMSEQSLNAKLNERRDFTIREAEKIIDYLGIENPHNIFFNQSLRGT